jgi:murein L,D-transpeptidase YcbB/YkuD
MAQINQEEATRNLQRYLRELSYDSLGANPVPIDGIFDRATRDALMDFQQREALEPNGIADKQTWDALYAAYRKKTALDRAEMGLYLFPDTPVGYELSPGEAWLLVNLVQLLLIELSVAYDIFENVTESGVYDKATEEAIKYFQRINLLPETGKVDAATYARIVREYTNIAKDSQ